MRDRDYVANWKNAVETEKRNHVGVCMFVFVNLSYH